MIKQCKFCGKIMIVTNATKYCSAACSRRAVQAKRPARKTIDSLCWDCQNAVAKCSWSINFIPVEGWEAKPIKIKQKKNIFIDSFIVLNCPKFIRDKNRRSK